MWHDLHAEETHRPAERDVEITDVRTMGVKGNPKGENDFYTWGIVKVETDAGVHGVGETFRGEEAMDIVHRMAPLVVGQNPLDADRIHEHLSGNYTAAGDIGRSAITAIETACWDIKGKLFDVPVYELFGGKYRDEIVVYSDTDALAREADTGGDHGDYTPEAFAASAREVVDRGFQVIKFDLDRPTPGHPTRDPASRRMDPTEVQHKVDLVRAVREEIGYEVDLGMDLHWKFTVETAVRLGRKLEEFDLAFIEDPVHPQKLDAQARVKRAIDVPVLNGENVVTINAFYDLLKHDALDIAAPDVSQFGGLAQLRKVAALCDVFGVPMAPHNLASPVGTVAGVHVSASIPNFYSLEYRGGDAPWWEDVVVRTDRDAPILEGGTIDLPEGPGLGIEVDPDGVEGRLIEGSENVF
jgi:L-alanine-DL-glutamate epimerase-like enolase superfamily enzyme